MTLEKCLGNSANIAGLSQFWTASPHFCRSAGTMVISAICWMPSCPSLQRFSTMSDPRSLRGRWRWCDGQLCHLKWPIFELVIMSSLWTCHHIWVVVFCSLNWVHLGWWWMMIVNDIPPTPFSRILRNNFLDLLRSTGAVSQHFADLKGKKGYQKQDARAEDRIHVVTKITWPILHRIADWDSTPDVQGFCWWFPTPFRACGDHFVANSGMMIVSDEIYCL